MFNFLVYESYGVNEWILVAGFKNKTQAEEFASKSPKYEVQEVKAKNN